MHVFRIMMGVELYTMITHSHRANLLAEFYPHSNALGVPNLSWTSIPQYPLSGPYVEIQNRLAIVKFPDMEIWSCAMSPTAAGFVIVSNV